MKSTKNLIFQGIITLSLLMTVFMSNFLYAESTSLLLSFRQEFLQLVKEVEKCAVSIEAHMGVGEQVGSEPAIEMINSGAGLVLNSNHIVVKQKIVLGSDQIIVKFHDKTVVEGAIVGSDDDMGLSIIRIGQKIQDEFLPKTLDDPALIAAGEPVLILSNSLGIMPAVSFGMVNCIRNDGMIQLSADLPAGTSGGAVFNFGGELIGVVAVAIDFFPDELPYSSDLLASEAVLVNPIRDIKRSLTHIIEKAEKKQIYFGVSVGDWPSHLGGAHIKTVFSGSPAAQSGIKTGDIVLSTDNHKVSNASDLFQIISSHNVGDDITMQILRGDQIFPITVKLAKPSQTSTHIDDQTRPVSENNPMPSEQQKKLYNDYLYKRLQKLEMEVKILQGMMEKN